jgi:hypothetical protein
MRAKTEAEAGAAATKRSEPVDGDGTDAVASGAIALQLAELAEELSAVLLVGVDAFDL